MTNLSLTSENRAHILGVIFGVLLLILAVRLFVMQTLEHAKYAEKAEKNRIRIVPEIAFRGMIFDRNGEVIVENRPSYSISAIPKEIDDIETVARNLSEILAIPDSLLAQRIRAERFRRYKPIRIARSVSFETVCKIEENPSKYPGIIFQLEPARKYPAGGILSHAVGYTGEISEKELAADSIKGVSLGTDIGREGIEKYWDKQLRGRNGANYWEITAEGKILGSLEEMDDKPAIPGRDLIVALDYELQQYAASLFADTLTGACVALDPGTGEILAFVSVPTYDANLFTGVLMKDDWDQLLSDERKPLLNRVIKGEYPPGSTYKLLIAGAALEEGIINRHTRYAACRGGYKYGNRIFKCWDLGGHGSLGVVDAIIQSCDVYFYQMGQMVGYDKFAEYSRKCGFGSTTGIDIPGEMDGLVPDIQWYDRRYGKGKWPRSLIINLSIGQGEILATPLQLANFYAALGNGGKLYRPHFLKAVITDEDTTMGRVEIKGRLPFSKSTLAILKEAAVGVVYGEHGTARGSRIEGIKFGGKTGTAQNPHGKEHALFCAYAPAEDPVIAITVVVEQGGHGSEAAAPLASKVIRRYLEKLNMLPEPDTVETLFQAEAD
ncbi:MAG TPA: penicillin-binding protein 2 [candidate division Zixibacteria bacterium]|nr:penicillin-binding protein 2 [candidate division Zixibacteria bacterium]